MMRGACDQIIERLAEALNRRKPTKPPPPAEALAEILTDLRALSGMARLAAEGDEKSRAGLRAGWATLGDRAAAGLAVAALAGKWDSVGDALDEIRAALRPTSEGGDNA